MMADELRIHHTEREPDPVERLDQAIHAVRGVFAFTRTAPLASDDGVTLCPEDWDDMFFVQSIVFAELEAAFDQVTDIAQQKRPAKCATT